MELYQSLITLDGWTFLAQVCNLMIQLVIFKKLLLNPVKKVIAERKAKADSQIADAEKLRTEAEAMKAEYEQNLQNARTEANQIVAAARRRLPPAAKSCWARPAHRPLPSSRRPRPTLRRSARRRSTRSRTRSAVWRWRSPPRWSSARSKRLTIRT